MTFQPSMRGHDWLDSWLCQRPCIPAAQNGHVWHFLVRVFFLLLFSFCHSVCAVCDRRRDVTSWHSFLLSRTWNSDNLLVIHFFYSIRLNHLYGSTIYMNIRSKWRKIIKKTITSACSIARSTINYYSSSAHSRWILGAFLRHQRASFLNRFPIR